MSVDDELRRQVAQAHGLDPRAATFITGDTLDEVEASAAELAQLVDTTPEPAPRRDVFTEALTAKAQRQRQLAALFTERPARERDAQGRYTARASGFDGGARQSVPAPADPHADHDELVVQLARLRAIR